MLSLSPRKPRFARRAATYTPDYWWHMSQVQLLCRDFSKWNHWIHGCLKRSANRDGWKFWANNQWPLSSRQTSFVTGWTRIARHRKTSFWIGWSQTRAAQAFPRSSTTVGTSKTILTEPTTCPIVLSFCSRLFVRWIFQWYCRDFWWSRSHWWFCVRWSRHAPVFVAKRSLPQDVRRRETEQWFVFWSFDRWIRRR